MKHFAVAAALCVATTAFAQDNPGRTIEGSGRVALQGGYRYTPNADFIRRAEAGGHPVEGGAIVGGPQFSASFGYAPLDWVEATIDLIVGFEAFRLRDLDDFTSTTYGALLGVRLEKMDFPFRGLMPHFGVQLGPVLSFISGKSIAGSERFNTGYSINAGLSFRFADRWAVGFDVRYLFAYGNLPEVATFNAGGLWGSLSVTFFIPSGPKDPMGGML